MLLWPFAVQCSLQLLWLTCVLCSVQPYIPVFWYPWGSEQKMTAAMSSRRVLNPHMQSAMAESQSKRNLGVNRQAAVPANNGGANGQTIV